MFDIPNENLNSEMSAIVHSKSIGRSTYYNIIIPRDVMIDEGGRLGISNKGLYYIFNADDWENITFVPGGGTIYEK